MNLVASEKIRRLTTGIFIELANLKQEAIKKV